MSLVNLIFNFMCELEVLNIMLITMFTYAFTVPSWISKLSH